MVYSDKNAVYALNSYVRKLLSINLGIDPDDYGDRDPIVPAAQQPELMATGKPFLIYGSANYNVTHLYALRREAITYTIFATSSTEANKIVNLLVDAFERQDEAAADVNEWLDTEAVGRGTSRNASFATIRVNLAEHAQPADEEGGFVAGMVMLECRFTVDNPTIQTNGFSYV